LAPTKRGLKKKGGKPPKGGKKGPKEEGSHFNPAPEPGVKDKETLKELPKIGPKVSQICVKSIGQGGHQKNKGPYLKALRRPPKKKW